jgi:hypothetical protein
MMSYYIGSQAAGITDFHAKNTASIGNCRLTADEARRTVFEAVDIVWLRGMEEAMEMGHWIAFGHE